MKKRLEPVFFFHLQHGAVWFGFHPHKFACGHEFNSSARTRSLRRWRLGLIVCQSFFSVI